MTFYKSVPLVDEKNQIGKVPKNHHSFENHMKGQVGPDLHLEKFQVGFRTKGIFFVEITKAFCVKLESY